MEKNWKEKTFDIAIYKFFFKGKICNILKIFV